jgi:hypothetical protein
MQLEQIENDRQLNQEQLQERLNQRQQQLDELQRRASRTVKNFQRVRFAAADSGSRVVRKGWRAKFKISDGV